MASLSIAHSHVIPNYINILCFFSYEFRFYICRHNLSLNMYIYNNQCSLNSFRPKTHKKRVDVHFKLKTENKGLMSKITYNQSAGNFCLIIEFLICTSRRHTAKKITVLIHKQQYSQVTMKNLSRALLHNLFLFLIISRWP